MAVVDGVTVTAARCGFMKNGEVGVFCGGANTKARLNDCKVHHNGSDGLAAFTYVLHYYIIRKYPGTCK